MSSHKSKTLEQYIGRVVKITFKDGREERGFLRHNHKGYKPYLLETEEYDVIFPKTSVRRIQEEKEC